MRVTLNIGKKFPQITGPATDAFAAELIQAEDADFQEIALDMGGTTVISSMAIGNIFSLHMKMREQGRRLVILNANERITRLLRMVNMTELLAPAEAGDFRPALSAAAESGT